MKIILWKRHLECMAGQNTVNKILTCFTEEYLKYFISRIQKINNKDTFSILFSLSVVISNTVIRKK